MLGQKAMTLVITYTPTSVDLEETSQNVIRRPNYCLFSFFHLMYIHVALHTLYPSTVDILPLNQEEPTTHTKTTDGV